MEEAIWEKGEIQVPRVEPDAGRKVMLLPGLHNTIPS